MPAMGFFLGLSGIAIPAFLISLFPDRKRRVFSLMLVASAAPSILTPLLANELLKWSDGRGDAAFATIFQTPFAICGGALLLGGILLSLAKLKESRGELERPHRIRVSQLLRLRSLAIVLMLSLHAAADTTLYTFLPMFMASQFTRLPLPPATAVAGHGVAYVATRTLLSFWPEGKWHRGILCLAGPLGGTTVILTLWFGPAVSVPILYTLASMMFAAEYPVLVSEVSSESMAEFGSIVAGGMLVSELIGFALLKGTGRLADLTGDFRLALSVAACGFLAFGLIAALTGLGKRTRGGQSSST
jgi:MFS family permease